jgi:hypothetical protein
MPNSLQDPITTPRQISEYLNQGIGQSGTLSEYDGLETLASLFSQWRATSPTATVVPDPGNTLDTAYNVGSLSSTPITFTDAVSSTDTSDFYRFTLTAGSYFNLSLTGISTISPNDADVRLIRDVNANGIVDRGEAIASSVRGVGGEESINLSGLAAGSYFAQVYQYGGSTNYTLRMDTALPRDLLLNENDLGSLTSTPITRTNSVSSTDTSDLYRFTLGATSNFNLSLTGISTISPNDADVRLIRDVNANGIVDRGEAIASSVRGVGQNESINLSGLAAGTYFVQVYQYSGSTNYTLTVSGTGGSTNDEGQLVYLDFVSDQDSGEYLYSAAEQQAILQNIQEDYQEFDYTFTLTQPTSSNYSTVIFNADGIVGGLAEGIDFRNLNRSDNAFVNFNGLLGGPGDPALTSANVVALSSTIAAHELGHLSGLRHGDSYGPIGSGIHNPPGSGSYLPVYPGPNNADETTIHTMASPASVGQTLDEAVGDTFFGEREAVKLAFNENGSVVSEQTGNHGSIATAQALTLSSLEVPNPLLSGDNVGADFQVEALAVTGSLSTASQADFYSFEGEAGQVFNFEVISSVLDRIANSIDSQISIFDSTGNLVPYYTGVAFNNDEFESSDSIIIDLVLPEDGTYYIQVNAASPSDTGDYELFLYQFATTGTNSNQLFVNQLSTVNSGSSNSTSQGSTQLSSSNLSSVSPSPTRCFCATCSGLSRASEKAKVGMIGSSNLIDIIGV